MRIAIRPKIAVFVFTTLTILLIVSAVALLLQDFRKREMEHERLESESVTRMLIGQVEETLDGVDQVLEGVQDRLQALDHNRVALDSLSVHLLLKARKAGLKQVSSLSFIDARGRVVSSSRLSPATGEALLDAGELRRLSGSRSDTLFVANQLRREDGADWALLLARGVVDSAGRFLGAVVATLDLGYFEQHFELMNFDEPRAIALYLANGTLLVSRPHRENAQGQRAAELDDESLQASGNARGRVLSVRARDSRLVLMLGRAVNYPLMAGVTSDENDALAYWRATATPIALGVGLVCLLIVLAAAFLIHELSREDALARALRESSERYQRTMDSVTDAIVAINDGQKITMFNRAAENLFGLSAAEAVGRALEDLVPERVRRGLKASISVAMHANGASPESVQFELTGRRPDGAEFPVETTLSRTVIDGQSQLTVVWRDVTQRHRVESEQRQMNQQLRELSASLQNVREQERTRIARELHDDLGQQLTGLKLDLSWLNNRLKEGRPASQERLDSMRYLLDDAIAGVRRISSELRPLILDDLGFGEAVVWHAEEFSRRSGIEVDLDLRAADSVTDTGMATALFRIVQESLTNIVRHADATQVGIQLLAGNQAIVLRVEDNGQGMPDSVPDGGIGLVSMRERAMALGGKLVFGNREPAGAFIEVTVPVHVPVRSGDSS